MRRKRRTRRCRRSRRFLPRRPRPTPPRTPSKAITRSRRRRGRWPGGPNGGSGWPPPGTGWRPRTRRAATRSGPSRKRGTPPRPRERGGAPRRRAATHQPQQHRAAGEHHRPGRAGDAQPEGLCGRLQRPAGGHRSTRSSWARCCPGTRSTAPCCTLCSVTCRQQLARPASARSCTPCSPTPGTSARRTSPAPTPTACGYSRRWPKTPAGAAVRTPQRARHLDRLPATARASRRLQHPRGRDDYKMRARTVEPVFGQLKTCQKLTMMSRRGLTACENEWLLAATAHNLRKLYRHRPRANRHTPGPAARDKNAQDRSLTPRICVPRSPTCPHAALCDRLRHAVGLIVPGL